MKAFNTSALAAMLVVCFATYAESSKPTKHQAIFETAITRQQPMTTLKIRLVIDGKAVIATLADNPTVRDFYSMLPLTLVLSDHANTEKVAYLPRKLSKDGAPAGAKPEIGDIAYYAPWGNLAMYYKDFAYSEGLITLGTIDAGLEILKTPGPLKVTIEPMTR